MMMKFKITTTISFEIDAEDHCDATQKAESLVSGIVENDKILKKELKVEESKKNNSLIKLGEFSNSEILPYVSKKHLRKN